MSLKYYQSQKSIMIFLFLIQAALNECYMLTLVNNLRRSMSRRPLVLNTSLKRAIQYHTQDMYIRNYFAHVNKLGKGVGYRVKQQGFQFLTIGENIYKGYGDAYTVFKAWVNSPEHFKNLIDPEYTMMGFGKTSDIWGQEFGTPKFRGEGITYDPCRNKKRPVSAKYSRRYPYPYRSWPNPYRRYRYAPNRSASRKRTKWT
eukprot:NODE_887_length_3432_cov_0.206421.p3 type:complete len:201 gc:universal NODE_887_length_3432_cov_0.206421:304-906(+)